MNDCIENLNCIIALNQQILLSPSFANEELVVLYFQHYLPIFSIVEFLFHPFQTLAAARFYRVANHQYHITRYFGKSL